MFTIIVILLLAVLFIIGICTVPLLLDLAIAGLIIVALFKIIKKLVTRKKKTKKKS